MGVIISVTHNGLSFKIVTVSSLVPTSGSAINWVSNGQFFFEGPWLLLDISETPTELPSFTGFITYGELCFATDKNSPSLISKVFGK